MSSTVFTAPTMALAAHFPELDPVALLQLVEAPVVRLAFYEFRSRFWDEAVGDEREFALIPIENIKEAIGDFNENPAGFAGYRSISGGGHAVHPSTYLDQSAITGFMSRVFAWATQEYLKLPIAPFLKGESMGMSLLWGILGICIALHQEETFPAPLSALPAGVDSSDIAAWEKSMSGTLSYDPTWFPAWQEWRTRHETLKDSKERASFVRFWTAETAADFATWREDSQTAEIGRFLSILRYMRCYDVVPGDRFVTKHLVAYRGELKDPEELEVADSAPEGAVDDE
ncbi:hypothetical protein SAMD00023353_4200230 [Rosellinia necatrix]|uniref:Uncharacterized protein n=1 Tax=Rosellinia necatrix TaxID=77044 RepID=A0A1W2TP70_ROSNE|nr:hypothetical protein SAMD00023353_4200230 [Rosellinia necatrix]